MRLRPVVIGLLVIWGVFATAAFRSCGRPAQTVREPTPAPSLISADPSEVTQAYWLAARRVRSRCAKAVITREELQRRGEGIKSLADGKRVWAGLAQSYADGAAVNTEGAKELKSLPTERADPVAVERVNELADLLLVQADLMRKTGDECREMADLFAATLAEGDAFDPESPKGKEYDRREAALNAKMKQTVANEGAAEKQKLRELTTKAKATAATLAKKHGRAFPDLLGN
jgi:hypothetical protein